MEAIHLIVEITVQIGLNTDYCEERGLPMNDLSRRFHCIIHSMGMNKLEHPIFYNVPIGIRFEIGGAESVYLDNDENEYITNPKYVSEAVSRAKTIYENLPNEPDILRIDVYSYEGFSEQDALDEIYRETKLPNPNEIIKELSQLEGEDDEVEPIIVLQLYWDLKIHNLFIDDLLEKIIMADIGGCNALVSNVYFAETKNNILFHIYDDRGADLVSSNKESLFSIFKKLNSWILNYDREKINNIFTL